MAVDLVPPSTFDVWKEESGHVKELARFNTPKNQGGERCNGFEEFPKLLYMARRHPKSNKWTVYVEQDETTFVGMQEKVTLDAQAFNRTCQLEVKDKEMEDKAKRAGWRNSMAEALAYREDTVLREAKGAAERNYEEARMSPAARAEAEAFEKTTADHVTSIPEAPKRRGWPKGVKRGPRAKKIADLTQS